MPVQKARLNGNNEYNRQSQTTIQRWCSVANHLKIYAQSRKWNNLQELTNFPCPLEIAHQLQGTLAKDCLALSVWGTPRVSGSLIPSQVEPPVISPGVERLGDH